MYQEDHAKPVSIGKAGDVRYRTEAGRRKDRGEDKDEDEGADADAKVRYAKPQIDGS